MMPVCIKNKIFSYGTSVNGEAEMATNVAGHLYKVYVQTKDHPHVLEMIVTAESKDSASKKALSHVKESNPTKGRALKESQKNSMVLFTKKAGKSGCLVTNKLPVSAFQAIVKNIERCLEGGNLKRDGA